MTISGIPPTISHTIVTILWFYYQNLLYCKFKINNDEKSDNLSRSQLNKLIFFLYWHSLVKKILKYSNFNTFKMFTLNSIQKTKEGCVSFLSQLPQGRALRDVIAHAHTLCPELAAYVTANESVFNSRSSRDKGSVGKMVEFYIFGQLPNSDPTPDLAWGADIKATHFKATKGGYNAERVTITNCGSTGKPETRSNRKCWVSGDVREMG